MLSKSKISQVRELLERLEYPLIQLHSLVVVMNIELIELVLTCECFEEAVEVVLGIVGQILLCFAIHNRVEDGAVITDLMRCFRHVS